MVSGDKINIHDAPFPIETTRPDKILRHDISDEELEMLCETRSDFVLEFLWIAIGACVGALPAALTTMWVYAFAGSEPVARGIDDFIQVIIFWVGAALSIVLGVIAHKRRQRTLSLREQIRARSTGAKNEVFNPSEDGLHQSPSDTAAET